MDNPFYKKTILITGGTGSLGSALTKKILKCNPNSIRIFSRDETKQEMMKEELNDRKLRFLIGDVRDKQRLLRAGEDVDIIIHTAALKQIHVAEYNPFECIQTNINGSQNVIDVAMDEKVDVCLGVSTDKAVSPLNLYGSTKLAMEKLFVAANHYKGKRKTKFACVRYGNVFGSRGSVVPRFLEQIKQRKEIQVTNPKMTRFNIVMDDAIQLIFDAIKFSKGGEVFIPKLKAYDLSLLINSFKKIHPQKLKILKIPIRSGEKLHELLLNKFEIPYTIDYNGHYVLLPSDNVEFNNKISQYKNSKKLKIDLYSSEFAPKLTEKELTNLIKKHSSVN